MRPSARRRKLVHTVTAHDSGDTRPAYRAVQAVTPPAPMASRTPDVPSVDTARERRRLAVRYAVGVSLGILAVFGVRYLGPQSPRSVYFVANCAVLLSITLAVTLKLAPSSRAVQRMRVSREVVRYEEVVHE